MKKSLIFASVLWLAAAAYLVAGSMAAAFNWTETTHNFGKIKQGKPVVAEFAFTNKGQAPLVITNARGSCGCTGVEFPKSAILPGKEGKIKATFNAAAVGTFSKTVTVESNAEGGLTTLAITGEVVAEKAAR
ncbi:DUF1573 domain-containing protein [Tellurirhabdus bombi]|uniref:DUF1573 domain-containing protein n=1 Tax=Tellurirhabdus bombi TaxID=2907205 RepID=UPI001F3E2A75|nr:DUF1573 domain-containing protein [Tellurirhabdus bombi]